MPPTITLNKQSLWQSIQRCRNKQEADDLTQYLIDCHAGVYAPSEIRTEMAWCISTFAESWEAQELFERFNLVHPYTGLTTPVSAEEAYKLGLKIGTALKANPDQRVNIHAKQPPVRKKMIRNLIRVNDAATNPTTD